jgi:FkbM family methyltransferase
MVRSIKTFIRGNLERFINLLDYPELIKGRLKKIDSGFLKDLLFIRKKLGITFNTILDVGAAQGEWLKGARFVFPEAEIYGFEPIPESFRRLKAINGKDKNVHLYNFALSSDNKITPFYLNEFSYSSSLLKMQDRLKELFPFAKNETMIDVECKRFDSIPDIKLHPPVYVKLDVQGAEMLVLAGIGKLIEKIELIQMEINFEILYYQQANYDEVFSYMKRNRFHHFFQISPLYSVKPRQLISCDIIFLRQ